MLDVFLIPEQVPVVGDSSLEVVDFPFHALLEGSADLVGSFAGLFGAFDLAAGKIETIG